MTTDYKQVTKKERALGITSQVLVYIFLTVSALIVLFPFYYMILTSLKSFNTFTSEVRPSLFTLRPDFSNYIYIFENTKIFKFILNTFVYSVSSTALMVLTCILAAFAFARLNFKGRELLFTLFLSLMIIPNELVIITNYVTVVDVPIIHVDMRNTLIGLVAPSIMSIFYIYLLRQNFLTIPDELYYAAKVDGTKDFKYLWKVMIPLAKPTIISITILKLIECWNAYVWPRLIATEESHYLISNALQKIKEEGFGRDNIPAMMAAVVIVSVPILIIFLIFRKQIMTGVSRSGIKG